MWNRRHRQGKGQHGRKVLNLPKKTDYQINHAIGRGRKRYGIHFTQAVYDALVAKIQRSDRKAVKLWQETYNRSHWAVGHDLLLYHVVYDHARHVICTLLPPFTEEQLTYHRLKPPGTDHPARNPEKKAVET